MAENPNANSDPFVFTSVPASDAEALSENPASFATRIAKTAMMGYFKRYFDGDLSPLLQAFAPRMGVTLSTDSVQAESQDKRYLQIAKKMAKLWQKLPCILIVDSGSQIVSPGLGYYDRKDVIGTDIVYTMTRNFTVSMEFSVGHQSENGAQELMETVSLMLENRDEIGSIISGPQWEVRLPLTHQRAQVTTQQVGDDPTQTFAMCSVTADIQVEVWYFKKVPGRNSASVSANPVGAKNIYQLRKAEYPRTIRIGQKPVLAIKGYPPTVKVYTSDPGVALISNDSQRVIIPIKTGECSIRVYDEPTQIDDTFPLTITV